MDPGGHCRAQRVSGACRRHSSVGADPARRYSNPVHMKAQPFNYIMVPSFKYIDPVPAAEDQFLLLMIAVLKGEHRFLASRLLQLTQLHPRRPRDRDQLCVPHQGDGVEQNGASLLSHPPHARSGSLTPSAAPRRASGSATTRRRPSSPAPCTATWPSKSALRLASILWLTAVTEWAKTSIEGVSRVLQYFKRLVLFDFLTEWK